jgi:2-phosphosulfolactate phosphatase
MTFGSMPHSLDVHFLPELTAAEELAGGTVVVIDVLRASTTITYALAAGAREVIPCLEINEARHIAGRFPPEQVVLGGERGGLPIEGFQLGNSPAEYRSQVVRGKTVAFTTTNGTKALRACREARRVLIGSFVNAAAVCQALVGEERIHLVCAGTGKRITREDVLLAGLLMNRMISASPRFDYRQNDEAVIAGHAWHVVDWLLQGAIVGAVERDLEDILRTTEGGRNLEAVGLGSDIALAANIDRFDFVPELYVEAWSIRLPGGREAPVTQGGR